MTAEQRGEHPKPKEPERFDAKSCLSHSTAHNPPNVFSLSSDETFKQFIPDSKKWGKLTFPGMEERIAERVSGIVRNWDSYETFATADSEDMADLSKGIDRKFFETDRSLRKRTRQERDFEIVTQPDGFYMIVSHPQADGNSRTYVAVNLTAMHTRDPHYVQATLEEIYVRKGAHDIIAETHKEVLFHEQQRKDYEWIYMLDDDQEKRIKELKAIATFLKAVGEVDNTSRVSIRSQTESYKPPEERRHPKPQSDYLEHVKDCPAASDEERAVKDKLPDVWNVLNAVKIKPLQDALLINPLEYTEVSLQEREKEIPQYDQLAEFLDKETADQDFSEFVSDLGTKLPDIQRQFTEFQNGYEEKRAGSFEDQIIHPIMLTGVFGRPTMEDVDARITIKDNPLLQELTKIIVLKYIQDKMRKEATTDSSVIEEQINDYTPLIAETIKTIKEKAGTTEEKRAALQKRRNVMNQLLEKEEIDPEEISELEQRVPKSETDRQKTFFLAFHMKRLQKAGQIDTTSPVFAQAVTTYFPQKGENALEAVNAAA